MKTLTNIGKIRLIGACLIMCATAAWACWIVQPGPCPWITTCMNMSLVNTCSPTCSGSGGCSIVYQTCPAPNCQINQCVPAPFGAMDCLPFFTALYCENDIYYFDDGGMCDKMRSEGWPGWPTYICDGQPLACVQEQGALQPVRGVLPIGSCFSE
jgi:hypothetical protein